MNANAVRRPAAPRTTPISKSTVAKEALALARAEAEAKGEDPDKVAIPIGALDYHLRLKIKTACEEIRSLMLAEAAVKTERETIRDERLAPLMKEYGLTAVDGETFQCRAKYSGDRKTISAEKLLELGVPAATIKAATVVTEGKVSYVVTGKKDEG